MVAPLSIVPTKCQLTSRAASKLVGSVASFGSSLVKGWPGSRGPNARFWFLHQPPAGVWKLTMFVAIERACSDPYHDASRFSGMFMSRALAAGGDGGRG